MNKKAALNNVKESLEFFLRATRPLTEQDSAFRPTPEMMSVAEQVAHVANTVDWFIAGAFSGEGFNLDFASHAAELKKYKSLAQARTHLEQAYGRLAELINSKSDQEWNAPLSAGPVMGGEPRENIILSIIEHTAHHRGSLAVYTRLTGKVPLMPYMDM